jgi:death-on-curing protein
MTEEISEPVWVLSRAVLAVHRRQLAEHGGQPGVRDENLLQSALARPQNLFACRKPPPDLAALAASYAFGLAQNHAFLDGNKRTALVVCLLFLEVNGLTIISEPEETYQTFYGMAAGSVTEEELAVWLREHSS